MYGWVGYRAKVCLSPFVVLASPLVSFFVSFLHASPLFFSLVALRSAEDIRNLGNALKDDAEANLKKGLGLAARFGKKANKVRPQPQHPREPLLPPLCLLLLTPDAAAMRRSLPRLPPWAVFDISVAFVSISGNPPRACMRVVALTL